MKDFLGLLLWQGLIALMALTLWFLARGRGEASRDRRGQVVAAWLLLAGAGLGVVPVLVMQHFFVRGEILMALAPGLLTLVFCALVLLKPARSAEDVPD